MVVILRNSVAGPEKQGDPGLIRARMGDGHSRIGGGTPAKKLSNDGDLTLTILKAEIFPVLS